MNRKDPATRSPRAASAPVFLCLLSAFHLISLTPAHAKITVELALDPPKIEPGQQAELVISIHDVPREATIIRPTLTEIDPALRHIFVTSSRSFIEVNGRFIQRTTALYRITGDEPGTYAIPPQTVEVDGIRYQTNAAEFTVTPPSGTQEPKPNYDPILKIEFAKSEIFVGEVIPVTVHLLVHKETRLVSPGRVELPREDFVVKRFPARPDSSVAADDQGYIAYSYTTALSGIRPGSFSLGPAALDCIVEFPVERQLGRGFPAFQLAEPRRFNLKSDPGQITVIPLPEGAPPGFRDAVGRFVMHASATPSDITAGDPVSLDVEITGTGNLDSLTMPTFADPEGWKLYNPKVHGVEGASGLEPTTVSFSQIIVPNSVVDAIPPLRFVHFDPESKAYVTLESDPIPLKIAEAPPPPSSPSDSTSPASSGGTSSAPVPEFNDIVTPLARPSPASLSLADAPAPILRQKTFWIFQSIPLTIVLLLASVHLRRWIHSRTPKEKKPSPKLIIRELEQPGLTARRFYRLAGSLVDSWVARRGPGASLSPDLSQIIERQHALCYTAPGNGGEIPVPPPERERVITSLKSLKF